MTKLLILGILFSTATRAVVVAKLVILWYCKTRVTSYELQVESLKTRVKFKSAISNPQVRSSNPRVTSSNARATSSNARATSSNPRVTSSNPRITSSNPRVKESLNQWKLR